MYAAAGTLKKVHAIRLEPGESRDVEVRIPVANLAYYNDTLRRWVVDADEFAIHAGSSSTDLRGKASFKISESSLAAR